MMKEKRKMHLSKSQKKVEKKITKFYFFIAGALFVLLVYLIGNSLGIFDEPSAPKSFPVSDECGNIMGNVIHNLEDEGDCKIKCENNCKFRELEYYNSSFISQETTCNLCDCWCI